MRMSTRLGMEARTGAGARETGNLESGNRGGSEDARRRATPTSKQQSQPQDLTPQRDRRIMLSTRAQGRETRDRTGEGSGELKKRKKPHKSCRRHVGNGGDLGGKIKNVDKKVLVQ